ncbi:M23 family metallopeptidase [Oceanispirochaeta sp. M1]|nr:M23 family metallopeptidase [Oceanispirochaeta sp. M1]RDG33841.1 M23 family peptidase [Oceanispirochaeta sp. M1]
MENIRNSILFTAVMKSEISNNKKNPVYNGGSSTVSILSKICQLGRLLLQDRDNCLIRLENQPLINGESSAYTLSLSFIDDMVFVLDEQIRSLKRQQLTHYHWVLHLDSAEDAMWKVKSCSRNSMPLQTELIQLELIELHERVDGVHKGQLPALDVPAAFQQNTDPGQMSGLLKNRSSRVFTLAAAALVMSGLFLTVFISTMQYGRMLKTVLTLSESISDSSESSTMSLSRLSDEVSRINREVFELKQEVFQEEEAFVFNKKQTSMNLRWLASRFPRSSSSRAHAYHYLADQIDSAVSYGEMVYQLTRLPENNDQAETLMATDKDNPMSMKYFTPVFPEIGLPVISESEAGDSADFMISSGYINRRLSPLGYGGVKPHFAVDLINLDNIVKISEDNEIIRDHSRAGHVQAVYEGTVQSKGYDWVYGWNMELKHPLLPEVKKMYPAALFWTSFYAHMESTDSIETGAYLKKGETFAFIGSSGKSTGPHLHYEIRIYHPGGKDSNSFGSFDRINPYLSE